MRKIEYLSPTSITLWRKDRVEFYRRYLSDQRPLYDPQTVPMLVGVCFDALVKQELVKRLIGQVPERLSYEGLTSKGIAANTLKSDADMGRALAQLAFSEYVNTGTLGVLMEAMERSPAAPQFEFTINGLVDEKQPNGLRIKGKPDLAYSLPGGDLVILDWKCNGVAGTARTSPKPGWYRCVGALTGREKYEPSEKLEDVSEEWAMQLYLYGVILGARAGHVAYRIEQVCGGVNELRFASYDCSIGVEWGARLMAEAIEIWEIIQSGWIFRDKSREESEELQGRLDMAVPDPIFRNLTR